MVKLHYPDGSYVEGTPEEIRRIQGKDTVREADPEPRLPESKRGRFKQYRKWKWATQPEIAYIQAHYDTGGDTMAHKNNMALARKLERQLRSIEYYFKRGKDHGRRIQKSKGKLRILANTHRPWTYIGTSRRGARGTK